MTRTETSHSTSRWLLRIAMVAACVVSLLPFLYVLSSAFKGTQALFSYPPEWIPKPIRLTSFRDLISGRPFPRWVANTLVVALTVTALKLVFDSMSAYAFTKLEFIGRRVIWWVMLTTVMIPPAVLVIPLFFIMRDLGWLDTYWALILPPLANPIGIFMLRSFMQELPDDLDNAARLDNCSEFTVYWRIVVPLIKPGLVVVGLYTFLITYTSFLWPLVASSDPEMLVLTTGLASLKPLNDPDWSLISAGAICSMVPITVVFLLFQRQFVSTSLAGALKQ